MRLRHKTIGAFLVGLAIDHALLFALGWEPSSVIPTLIPLLVIAEHVDELHGDGGDP